MKLVGLHGLPRSGKDSVARILISTKGYERIAFADPLKEAAATLLRRPLAECHGINYDREQVMPEWGFTMRWFLQVFGTECLRDQVRRDFWTRRLDVEIEARRAKDPACKLVITDVRFENETNFLRSLDAQIVEVWRPGLTASSHSSDQPVPCDWTIRNEGTLDDLFLKVIKDTRI